MQPEEYSGPCQTCKITNKTLSSFLQTITFYCCLPLNLSRLTKFFICSRVEFAVKGEKRFSTRTDVLRGQNKQYDRTRWKVILKAFCSI